MATGFDAQPRYSQRLIDAIDPKPIRALSGNRSDRLEAVAVPVRLHHHHQGGARREDGPECVDVGLQPVRINLDPRQHEIDYRNGIVGKHKSCRAISFVLVLDVLVLNAASLRSGFRLPAALGYTAAMATIVEFRSAGYAINGRALLENVSFKVEGEEPSSCWAAAGPGKRPH